MCLQKVTRNRMEIGDAVIVDADKNEVQTEYDDLEALPEDVVSYVVADVNDCEGNTVDSDDSRSWGR